MKDKVNAFRNSLEPTSEGIKVWLSFVEFCFDTFNDVGVVQQDRENKDDGK